MELYYRDLISEEASLEKLVDDLMLVVQGANDFAEAATPHLPYARQQEIQTRLQRLKEGCQRIRKQAVSTALATDKLLRRYPYSAFGFAFACGLLLAMLKRRKSNSLTH
jgi:ElaB/YqjD/DUF883 family membrane-anchored ribosome-binding protein